ncbi:hypothetical protein [Oryzobacter terrae]|uniref:hypothetical protein n=1 Tax=Oryzobacter terrae TaxID=1620385 RepID=UPI0036717AB3
MGHSDDQILDDSVPSDEGAMPPAAWSLDQRLLVWQTISDRRASLDAMMWQTPALGMAAQAFLFTLALGADVADASRVTAAFLSLVLSALVVQLMAKHRRHELLDALLLQRMEQELGFKTGVGTTPHDRPAARHADDWETASARLARALPGPSRFWQASSFELWMVGQALFAVAALAVALVTLTPLGEIWRP